MADMTIGERPVLVSSLPELEELVDDARVPVELHGESLHITGETWKKYALEAVAGAPEYAVRESRAAADAAELAKEEAETARDESEAARDEAVLAATNVAPLQAQFNAAISAVTTDTEVTNIRVGADGETYGTAGEAVRSQVGELKSKSMYYRGTVAAGTDIDTLTQTGYWRKEPNVTVTHGAPPSGRARIIAYSDSTYGYVQMWVSTVSDVMYMRTRASSATAWTDWKKIVDEPTMTAELNKSVMYRGVIATGTDMNTLTQPGVWRKEPNVSVVNGAPSTARARIVVLSDGSNSTYGFVQLWFSAVSGALYTRVKPGTSDAMPWTEWSRVVFADELQNAVLYRGTIASGTDMDTLLQPGFYRKEVGVSVVHGAPSTVRARIVVYNDNNYGIVQMWINTRNNMVYTRTGSIVEISGQEPYYVWTEWRNLFGGVDFSVEENGAFYRAEDVWALWDDLMAKYPSLITKTVLGQASGYSYPMYTINCTPYRLTGGYEYADSVSALYTKPRALVIASIHGDEPLPMATIYAAFRNLLETKNFALLNTCTWDIIPVGNPWGVSHSVVNANGDSVLGNVYIKIHDGGMPEGYSVKAHTADWHGNGIRFDLAGYDINRDFTDAPYPYTDTTYGVTINYNFLSDEAKLVRNLLQTNQYAFVLDHHISVIRGSDRNPEPFCGCIGLGAQSTGESENDYKAYRDRVMQRVDQANWETTVNACKYYGKEVTIPNFMLWSNITPTSRTLINYARGGEGRTAARDTVCDLSVMAETMSRMPYFDGAYNSAICNSVTVNYITSVMKRLGELVML